MGVGISNPVDGATKQEIEDLIKAIIKTFTLEYVKWYALYLVKKIKMDAMEPPSEYKLLERPPNTEHLRTGWLLKEGGIRKNWKKRFFVARHTHVVDYYEKEEEANKEKGKTKGSMSLCGYHVVEDPNDGIIKRLTNLSEKMGVNLDEIPKPKEYPKLCFEVHHYRRRCYFIKTETEEEFKDWVDTFRTVCRNAYGFRNKEYVHEHAFKEAVRRTRWTLGRWGWWSYGGSEEQVLSDLIADQCEYAVMGRIYSKITGPWTIRWTVRNQVMKSLDTLIGAGVAPAWKAMSSAVESLRPQIEPKIKELVEPIGKAEAEIMDKIKSAVMSVLDPLIEQHINPHLGKIMEIIQSPMTEAYDESYTLYNKELDKFEVKPSKDDLLKAFKALDGVRSSYDMYTSTRKLDILYEPLWALHLIFTDIYPWGMIYRGHDNLRKTMDNAMYTFEQKLVKAHEENEAVLSEGKALGDKFKGEVFADYQHDGRLKTIEWYADVLKAIIMPPFEAVAGPATDALLGPISDAIPEPMKQFIDPQQMFTDLLNSIVEECIKTVVSSGQK